MADGYKFKNEGKTGEQIYAEISRKRQALIDLGTSLITTLQAKEEKRLEDDNPPRTH